MPLPPTLVHGTCQFSMWTPNPLSIYVFNHLQQRCQCSQLPRLTPTDANPTSGMEILYSPTQIRGSSCEYEQGLCGDGHSCPSGVSSSPICSKLPLHPRAAGELR